MILALSILAGAAILLCQWLYGNKSVWGPLIGLVGQVPWLGLIMATGAWGLLLSWVPMTAIHARNLWRWRRETRNGGNAERETHAATKAKVERLGALLPDPRGLPGWDDPDAPPDVLAHLAALAEAKGIEMPAHVKAVEHTGGKP